LTIDRSQFLRGVYRFMRNATESDLLLVKLGMGYGKTVSTWDLITEVCRFRPIMLNPRHDNILDTFIFNRRKSYRNFLHLQGRERPGMCRRPDVIELSKIINVSAICADCKFRNECSYIRTRRNVLSTKKPVMGVHSHCNLISELSYVTKFDCCIIDENPISTMLRTYTISKKPKELINFLSKTSNPIHNIINEMFIHPINYQNLETSIRGTNENDFKKFERDLIDNHKNGGEAPKRSSLIKEVERAVYSGSPIHSKIYWTERWEDGKKFLNVQSFDKSIFTVHCPAIVLDATGSKEFYASISGRNVESIEQRKFDIPNNIAQVIEGKYSISTLVSRHGNLTKCGVRHVEFINAILKSISNRKRSVVTIASSKRFKKCAGKYLNGEINWVHFYGNRGTNTVMNISDVMIIGMCPNIPQIERETNADVTPIPEDRWDDILIREEIVQTIGRIRLDLDSTETGEPRGPRKVIILTNVDLGYNTCSKYQLEQEIYGRVGPIPESEHMDKCAREIMSKMHHPMTANMIAKKVSRSRGLVFKTIRWLLDNGKMKENSGIYRKVLK